jgi:hypothetical protein
MTSTLPTVIGLGRLVDFIIRDAQGRRLRVTPTGERWLAWKADTRDLVVLQSGREVEISPPSREAKRHRVFHGAEPRCVRQMEWPKPTAKRRTIGLIEAVTYVAAGIRSPSKGPHHWIHQFGDRGEHGHGAAQVQDTSTYAERLMPQLDIDAAGNIFVRRRSGNRFMVRDWIIG